MKMFKAFATSFQMAYALAEISGVMDETWDLPFEEFTAIEKSSSSEYWLKGKYGPGPRTNFLPKGSVSLVGANYLSKYLYIFLEVGGAEIPDGATVTTQAIITRPQEYEVIKVYDEWDGDSLQAKEIANSVLHIQTDTVECAMKYITQPDEEKVLGIQEIADENESGLNYWVSLDEVNVRSFDGKITNDRLEITGSKGGAVWHKQTESPELYTAGSYTSSTKTVSWAGCYMTRLQNDEDAEW